MSKISKSPLTVILVVLMLFVLVMGGARLLGLQTVPSYVTMYQGAKGRFYGMYDIAAAKPYTNGRFDTQLFFDPDEATSGMGNLEGECTAIQIPLGQSQWVPPDWVPRDWWTDAVHWKNPDEVYEWQLPEGEETDLFRMEKWLTKWFVSVEGSWDSLGMWWENKEGGKRYRNWEIWFQFDLNPVWYFENQTVCYFAIAKLEVSSIKIEGYDTKIIDLTPESAGSVLTVYLNPFGVEENPSESDFTQFYYNKLKLNPEYFRDVVYAKIILNDFGSQSYSGFWGPNCQADVVTFGFTVTQFVVGEWKVKDIGDIPEDYGRTSKIQYTPSPWDLIGEWLTNPWTLFWMGILGSLFLLVLLIVFAPGLLAIIAAWIFGRRKGGGKG